MRHNLTLRVSDAEFAIIFSASFTPRVFFEPIIAVAVGDIKHIELFIP
jgi:hypothetical protein